MLTSRLPVRYSDVSVSLDAAEFSAGHLHAHKRGLDLDTHVWVGLVAEVHVVEVETELEAVLADADSAWFGGCRQIHNEYYLVVTTAAWYT